MNMMQIFKLGDELTGFCNGHFGRDDYEDKTCIMVTPKYAVFECHETGIGRIINYTDGLELDAKAWIR